MLDNHVATDVKDSDEWQPVHAAACWGHVSLFLLCLLELSISIWGSTLFYMFLLYQNYLRQLKNKIKCVNRIKYTVI